jgi:hypothetical protein
MHTVKPSVDENEASPLSPPSAPAENVLRDELESSRRGVRGAAAKVTTSFANAVSAVFERSIDRMLATSDRVTSAAEGRALLAAEESGEAATERLQKMVVFAVAVLRSAARGARFTRVPWVLVVSTAMTTGLTVRTGAREVQVLGSLLAHRIEEATGRPADPALVKKLTVELYLAPKRVPELADRRLRLHRLIRRWVFRGAFGRKTRKNATKALEAAERLDVGPLVSRWAELGSTSSPEANQGRDPAPSDATAPGPDGPTPERP